MVLYIFYIRSFTDIWHLFYQMSFTIFDSHDFCKKMNDYIAHHLNRPFHLVIDFSGFDSLKKFFYF
ncbi:hypothetical protein CBF27_03900 [Vagococcus acidifermentans]|uniref:Uncharacterized protein n=1 Tax=Vagococcus acidifermentans TaxID=564710 RepID=A0A430AZ35_9ENTE|nr:hypothetical protein CBF27_03900 [Vagococcus acidifermentans]